MDEAVASEVKLEDLIEEGSSEKNLDQFEGFLASFNSEKDPEKRLRMATEMMSESLNQGKSPRFKAFWEARKLCLPLFREAISASARSELWDRYNELSREARHIKDLLDEQSNFAVEQLEIAIKALEDEVNHFEENLGCVAPVEEELFPKTLRSQYEKYNRIQRHLNLHNAHAGRVNSLRKELMKTDMRVRFKNQFFQRLSKVGDLVFPPRKSLIKEVSQQFLDDVQRFIDRYFENREQADSPFFLRDEIKQWQTLAKVLTLNAHSFNETRKRLSSCWDGLKEQDKEKKKERAAKKEIFTENRNQIMEQIQRAIESAEGTSASSAQKVLLQFEEILKEMRQIELGRDEVKELKDAITEARKPFHEAIETEANAHRKQAEEREKARQEFKTGLKVRADTLLAGAAKMNLEAITTERDAIMADVAGCDQLNKSEKQLIEKQLRPLRAVMTEKREEALLNLSDDVRANLTNYQKILDERKARAKEIKDSLEHLRKAKASSGMDFEKAITLDGQIQEERALYEKTQAGVIELEQKIKELKALA
jgi:hypothetical protein